MQISLFFSFFNNILRFSRENEVKNTKQRRSYNWALGVKSISSDHDAASKKTISERKNEYKLNWFGDQKPVKKLNFAEKWIKRTNFCIKSWSILAKERKKNRKNMHRMTTSAVAALNRVSGLKASAREKCARLTIRTSLHSHALA